MQTTLILLELIIGSSFGWAQAQGATVTAKRAADHGAPQAEFRVVPGLETLEHSLFLRSAWEEVSRDNRRMLKGIGLLNEKTEKSKADLREYAEKSKETLARYSAIASQRLNAALKESKKTEDQFRMTRGELLIVDSKLERAKYQVLYLENDFRNRTPSEEEQGYLTKANTKLKEAQVEADQAWRAAAATYRLSTDQLREAMALAEIKQAIDAHIKGGKEKIGDPTLVGWDGILSK